MSEDVVVVGFSTETSGIQEGAVSLEKLAVAGDKADKAIDGLEETTARAGKSLDTLGKFVVEGVRGVDDFATKSGLAKQKIVGLGDDTKKAAEAINSAGEEIKRISFSADEYKAILNDLGVSTRKITEEQKRMIDVLANSNFSAQEEKIIGSLIEQQIKLERTSGEWTAFKMAQKGMSQEAQLVASTLADQNAKLKETSLASEFANRALKSATTTLMRMVNPAVLAISAVTALVVGLKNSSKESENHAKALIITGNAAGVTADQLSGLSRAMADGSRTQAESAKAIDEMVRAGVTGADALQRYASAAVDWEKATGQSVSKAADQFKKLQDEPLKALASLNKEMNFLTPAIYEQVKALEEQGKKSEAAKVAQDALATATADRAKQVKENLGNLEKSWNAIKEAAKSAWDSMLNVGRADVRTPSDKIAELNNQIADLLRQRKRLDADPVEFYRSKVGASAWWVKPSDDQVASMGKDIDDRVDALMKQRGELTKTREEQEKLTNTQKASAEATKALIEWDKEAEKHASKKVKMQRELTAVTKEHEQLVQKLSASGELTKEREQKLESELKQRQDDIRKQYTEKTKGSTGENELTSIRAAIKAEEEYAVSLDSRGAAAERLSAGERKRIELEEKLTGKLNDKQRANIEQALSENEYRISLEKSNKERTKAYGELKKIEDRIREEEALTAAQSERDATVKQLTWAEKEALEIEKQLTGNISDQARETLQLALSKTKVYGEMEKQRNAREEQQKWIESTIKSAEAIDKQAKELEAANAVFGKGKVAVQELREEEVKRLLAVAKTLDVDKNEINALKLKSDAMERLTKAMKEAEVKQITKGLADWSQQVNDQLVVYEQELRLAGATTLERQKQSAILKADLKLRQELKKIEESSISESEKQRAREEAYDINARERAAGVAKAIGDDFQKTADQINQSLTDALMRGFEDGKSFGKNFADTLKNMFKTMVLRPIISLIVQPVGNLVSGVISGVLGGNAGGGGGVMGWLNKGSSAYSMFSGNNPILNWASGLFGGGAAAAATPMYVGGMGGALAGSAAMPTFGAVGGYGSIVGAGAPLTFSGAPAAYGSVVSSGAATGGLSAGMTALGVVAAPILIGLIAEMFDKTYDRHWGAASTSDYNPGVKPGSTAFDMRTGSLPDRDAMLAAINATIDSWGKSPLLGEREYKHLTAEDIAGINDRTLATFLAGEGNGMNPFVFGEQTDMARILAEYNKNMKLPDFYRGAGYVDSQGRGWWGDWGNPQQYNDPKMIEMSRNVALGIQKPIESVLRAVGKSTDDLITEFGFAYESGHHKGWYGHLNVRRGDEVLQDFGTIRDKDYSTQWKSKDDMFKAMFGAAMDTFKTLDLPGWASKLVDGTKEQINKLTGDDVAGQAAALYEDAAAKIAATYTAIQQFISIFPAFATASQDTVYTIAEAMGGMQNLQQSFASFTNNFYTAAERQRLAQRTMEEQFGQIGLKLPTSMAEYRNLVEAAIELTSADVIRLKSQAQEALSTTNLKMPEGWTPGDFPELGSGVFTVIDQIPDAISAINSVADPIYNLSEYFPRLREAMESSGMSAEELVSSLLGMNEGFAAFMQQMRESLGITYDSVRGLIQSVVKEAKSAEEARMLGEQRAGDMLMDAMMNVMLTGVMDSIMSSLIDPLVMNITAGAAQAAAMDVAVAAETAAIDVAGATAAAQTLAVGSSIGASAIYTGAAEAATVMAEGGTIAAENIVAGSGAAAQGIAGVVGQAVNIIRSISEVFSNDEFRAVYSDFTRAIGDISSELFTGLDKIGSSVGRVRAYEKAVESSGNAAQTAAQQITNAWKQIADSLMDEVRRIRGEIATGADQGLAYWEAQFAITTAQARAGDEDAAKQLIGLSGNVLRAAEREAGSMFELQQIKAAVAQSLQDSAAYGYYFAGGAGSVGSATGGGTGAAGASGGQMQMAASFATTVAQAVKEELAPVLAPVQPPVVPPLPVAAPAPVSSVMPVMSYPAIAPTNGVVEVNDRQIQKLLDKLEQMRDEQQRQAAELIKLKLDSDRRERRQDVEGVPVADVPELLRKILARLSEEATA